MRTVLIVPIIVPLTVACSRNIYTPPARPVMLTSPQTVDNGTTAVRASGSTSSELFGPSIYAGTIGIRHGLADDLELVADSSYAQIAERSAVGTNRAIGMARAGVKYRPHESPNLAVIAGTGGGYSPAAGAYGSADVGVIFGYENRYLVPFVSLGGYASVPLNPREVDVTREGDEDQFLDKPEKTVGATLGAGLRVPLAHKATSILVGLSHTTVWDNDSDNGFMSFAGAVETTF
ncbi:MAG: hypothetical protein GY811_24965 [Myxococcales bacterium]|nr:hypothetical protein [Myxococcales bacterium]